MTIQERELREAWASTLRSEQRGYLEGHRVGFIKGLVFGVVTVLGGILILTAALDWYWAWLR